MNDFKTVMLLGLISSGLTYMPCFAQTVDELQKVREMQASNPYRPLYH